MDEGSGLKARLWASCPVYLGQDWEAASQGLRPMAEFSWRQPSSFSATCCHQLRQHSR